MPKRYGSRDEVESTDHDRAEDLNLDSKEILKEPKSNDNKKQRLITQFLIIKLRLIDRQQQKTIGMTKGRKT